MGIKLDFSNFKHKSTDDKSTTLEHKKDKHTITLFHNALSKDNQEQLKALQPKAKESDDKPNYGKVMDPQGNKPQVYAEGGGVGQYLDDVADKFSGQKKTEKSNVPGQKPQQSRIQGQQEKSYEGFAEGGDVEQSLQFDPTNVAGTVPTPEEVYKAKIDANSMNGLADPKGAELLAGAGQAMKSEYDDKQANVLADREQDKQQTAMEERNVQNQSRAQAGLPPIADPQAAAMDASAQQSQGAQEQAKGLAAEPQQSGLAKLQNDPSLDPMAIQMNGYQNQIQGAKDQANALGAQGAMEAKALDESRIARANAKRVFDDSVADLTKTSHAYQEDIKNGYVDPNKYWTGYTAPNGQKVEGHSKITAAIGMLLAGFNPAGGENAASTMINKEIDRSIDAQKTNLQSQHNLLRANLEQYKNVSDAYSATRMQLNDDVMNRLQQAAAVAKNPLAQAAAKQQIGQLQIQQGQLARQLAMSQAMMKLNQTQGTSPSDPTNTKAAEQLLQQMYMFDPEKAKILAERIVPGVGVSSIPVPQGIREDITSKQQFAQLAQHYADFVKKNAGSLNPAKMAEGRTLAAELQGAFRVASKGGTYKEGEQEFIEGLVPSDPSQFLPNIRTLPKLQALTQTTTDNLNTLKRSYGLPASRPAVDPQQQALKFIQMNPNDPKAMQMKKMMGIK